jgi:hypothetical protein
MMRLGMSLLQQSRVTITIGRTFFFKQALERKEKPRQIKLD